MGSLEGAVLDVLWNAPGPLKPGDVLAQLSIDPPVTYSTVLTILRRLWKKGLVIRGRDGRAYRYTPTRTREEEIALSMASTFSAASDPALALGHFVANLTPEETHTLKKLLRISK